ncbi:MAG: M23 family metallopeptidase [Magnetococcales bacterium]|nr:M23 family metallopeptidase [Magnetococcales bacterium]
MPYSCRNRFTLSIVEVTGAHHYEMHVVMRKLLAYAALAVVVVSLITASAVIILQKNLKEAKVQKSRIADQLEQLMAENGSMAEQIRERLAEYREIDDKVALIEGLIGRDADSSTSLAERMELASLAIASREQEFKALGSRLETIEEMIGMEEGGGDEKTLAQRLDLASMTAAQKKVVLDALPSGYPVPSEEVSSEFGYRWHPILKKKEFHPGLDLRAKVGTPVKTTADGVVEYANSHDRHGFGRKIIVRHNYGFSTAYAHLDEILVEDGAFVRRGEVIGKSGNTGLSSGPHLHYEIRFIHNTLDPSHFTDWSMDNYDAAFEEKRIQWPSLLSLINQRLNNPTPPSLHLAQK